MRIDTTKINYNSTNIDNHEYKYIPQDTKRKPCILSNLDNTNDNNNIQNTNDDIINSIYGKLIYDYPPSMHLLKSQLKHICEIVNNKIGNGDLFHFQRGGGKTT